MVYISIRATIARKKNALPIMIGALIGFIVGIHDIRAYNDLELYSDDIVQKSKELEMYIRNITALATPTTQISKSKK